MGANGTLQKGYTYDEFGSIEENGNTNFLNEVTFTGSISDKSTGLQYMNARFDDPGTGRFISQDTYSGNPYDPWTHHLYVYCGNNPTNMVDPTGHAYSAAYGYACMIKELNEDSLQFLQAAQEKTSLAEKYAEAGEIEKSIIYYNMADSYMSLYKKGIEKAGQFEKKFRKKYNEEINEDILQMNFLISDEETVINAKHISFYKGRLVIKHRFFSVTSCAIGGIMFINSDEKSVETIKHEFGHTVQEKLRPDRYITKIALNSLAYYGFDVYAQRKDPKQYENKKIEELYYNMPWERTADFFGGVSRDSHKKWSLEVSLAYLFQ